MATSTRRVGAETSKTRDTLLDCVETMMLEEGYASVTYRALAAKAGVTPSLVQYYFPTLDDIFIAAIRRYSERGIVHLTELMEQRTDDPLRAVWEYSWDEATGAMITEFMALGNHRKSIRTEIAAVTENVRKLQLDALVAKFGKNAKPIGDLSLPALQLLMSGLPKFLNLEAGIGVRSAHAEVTEAFERYIDSVEPPAKPKRKSPARKPTARR
ncbi:AcrR family transcriptional regulator [Mycolicibacterium sp. BK556]|uniref:TetR/AcrR family transcriptional regulator n=1 Tax=Mycobacteriaceae TaxID=1762 RepID=UPI00106046E5|nr:MULTISPECIES: TetR/AcrR family transcriptional regulator [Mycobacteriaceae]MBB3602668.1 AcrR family transcriptional regulator [Mycolicibacterium sp. BK556]MBB3632420.1 AcrR family transcriptional regulator [Mycolicibacterium sp. BK607]MBB3750453.1 AcrR family transcriptional regulator [Mycolicibacterium sp. BK634]TDO18291.1 TetR family transcriptional regulator [Mycobacterium sp. BK086]